jgi:hypothetical protein
MCSAALGKMGAMAQSENFLVTFYASDNRSLGAIQFAPCEQPPQHNSLGFSALSRDFRRI